MCYQLLGKERGNILFPSGPLCSSAQGRNDVHHVCEQPERAGAGHGGRRPLQDWCHKEELSLGETEQQGKAARGQASW